MFKIYVGQKKKRNDNANIIKQAQLEIDVFKISLTPMLKNQSLFCLANVRDVMLAYFNAGARLIQLSKIAQDKRVKESTRKKAQVLVEEYKELCENPLQIERE